MANRIYLYPIWLRLWHIINAVFFLLLILTGLAMQYSTADEQIMEFSKAIKMHNKIGILITVNYLLFIITNLFSSNRKHYKTEWKGVQDRIFKQARFYAYGIFKGEEPPFTISKNNKFNPLQKLSYIWILYVFFPLLIISGIALLFPEIIIHEVFGLNGTLLTALLHMLVGFLMTLFLVIHIYFASLSKKRMSNFKAILTGWHDD